MATKADNARKEEKRKAVVARLKEVGDRIELLSGMWDENTLDALILAFGIGHVELNDD